MHIRHPRLKEGAVEFRGYQANLARICGQKDTLVVLPTGMGKTVVALLALADALESGARRILILAPTRPLVDQHAAYLAATLAPPWSERVHALTGHQSPTKRMQAYGGAASTPHAAANDVASAEAPATSPATTPLADPVPDDGTIVVATPQVVHNDVLAGRLDPAKLDWVVFDEAHRGVGEYPYAFLGQELQRKAPATRRLGLTASPGHDVRKIDEVRTNLGLPHVEIRTAADADVAPFVQDVGIEWETLPLPPAMGRVSAKLAEALAERIRSIKQLGLLQGTGNRPGRRDLLMLGSELQNRLSRTPNPDPALFTALSLQAQALKLQHAIEQVETQGSAAFVAYVDGMREEARTAGSSKATRSIAEDPRVNEAYHVARFDDAENPKLGRTGVLVREQLEANPASRIIVFTHYRTTCDLVARHLATQPGVKPVVFVGQGKRSGQEGLSQKEQQAIVADFRAGKTNTLVATSVAEEGLDIPATDLVVFFEPIPSEIRSIQRRGRTGRQGSGRVVVLMTKGTQDEAAHWASRRKEQQMVRELQGLRQVLAGHPAPLAGNVSKSLLPTSAPPDPAASGAWRANVPTAAPPSVPATPLPGGQARLGESPAPTPPKALTGPSPRIVYDTREQAGAVVRHLHELGCILEARTLDVGDFILSDRLAVERKSTSDFVDSLVDGRLFAQLKELHTYGKPFLIVEGESLHGHRNVSPESILGALAAVTVDHGIPVLTTRDALETARFLHAAAKREQFRENRKLAVRPAKPPMTDRERQLFVLCGLPGVSEVLAERLLDRFGTLQAVFDAPALQLGEVEGVGPAKATEVRRLLELAWPARRAMVSWAERD